MEQAQVVIDRDFVVGQVDRRIRGSFLEHLGRAVYGGIFEPGHPTASSGGFREDVLQLVKDLDVSVVRFPGGNFVSGYEWKNGIGPREERQPTLDLAWRAVETNAFGLNEFVEWCQLAGVEPFLVFNLGTRGIESACELVEYCNGDAGSRWAQLRRAHGFPAPHAVKVWGLGNEMDGAWQLGSSGAAAYGQLASQVARAVKRVDPTIELVSAGSSLRTMSTFPEWDRVVLEHVYDEVEYHALHQYYPANAHDEQSFAASGADFDAYLAAGVATCDYVRELKRSKRALSLSVDEWNVNYLSGEEGSPWRVAPPRAEFDYVCRDAVVEASLFMAILKHADRVRIACQSLLVNVGAPIRTQPSGPAWTQAIYAPLQAMFRATEGADVRGTTTRCSELPTAAYGDVPTVDAVALANDAESSLRLFLVNRSLDQSVRVAVRPRGWDKIRCASCRTLAGSRESAIAELRASGAEILEGGHEVFVELDPLSWSELVLAV